MDKVTKVTLGGLSVQLTHRCDMRCGHCMRGEAEDRDINLDDVDALLEQVEIINSLELTGGEPLLNVGAINHIAYGIAKRGILLFRLQIVTNGLLYDEEFVKAIKRFRQIIDISRQVGCEDEKYDPAGEKWRVCVGVSLDRFHESHDVCESNFLRYKEALEDIADVLRVKHGNVPIRMGRAETLPEAVDQSHTYQFLAKQRIEVLDANHTPVCKTFEQFKLVHPGQKIICCAILLNVDGSIRNDVCGDYSYKMLEDFPIVCKATDPLWESVLAYQEGRMSCVESNHAQLEFGLNHDFYRAEAQRLTELESDPDAKDEQSSFDSDQNMQAAREAIQAGCTTIEEIQDFMERQRLKQTVSDYERSWETVAQASHTYHHGSGVLPAYKQSKRSKVARCDECGEIIVDEDGEPINSTPISHTRRGTYYKCKSCDSIIFVGAGQTAIDATSDKSKRCWWCGKTVINSDGEYVHCGEDFYNPGRIVCHYCKHQI